jgi:hypothetical protein
LAARGQVSQIINAGITVVTACDGREYDARSLKPSPALFFRAVHEDEALSSNGGCFDGTQGAILMQDGFLNQFGMRIEYFSRPDKYSSLSDGQFAVLLPILMAERITTQQG